MSNVSLERGPTPPDLHVTGRVCGFVVNTLFVNLLGGCIEYLPGLNTEQVVVIRGAGPGLKRGTELS